MAAEVPPTEHDLPANGGEMGRHMRAHDWAATPLRPPAAWPSSLRTLVGVMLAAAQPMFIAWGPKRILLYNDAYAPLLGRNHPAALGRPFFDVWPEVRNEIGPLFEQVFAGEAVHRDDIVLFLEQHGHLEEAHFAFSYTPVHDGRGAVAGLFCSCTETTAQVLAERQHLAETEQQQQLSEALRRSEAEFRATFEQAAVGVAQVGLDGRWLRVNPRLCAMLGYPEAELLACTFQQVTHPEDVAPNLAHVRRLLAGEAATYDMEKRYLRRDGATVWAALSSALRRDPDTGAPLHFISVIADITARKCAEAALRELNADLERQVIERTQARGRTWQVSPDLLGALNAQGFFETSNPAWQTVLGWSEQEVASMSIFELLHPDDVERTRAGFAFTQRSQPAIRFPNRYRCKGGGHRWISWVGVPEDGLVYCSGRDITTETEQAAELAKRTAERDRLWRNTQDIQIILDGAGVFRAVNPAFSKILGWSPAEVIGRTVFDFIVLDDGALTEGALQHARKEALPVVENRYRHRDGGFRWIAWVAAPEGELIYASGRHITAEKEQAEALQRAEEQLRQSQKMEAVGQLTGGIAHDFNNLLTGISGSLELLQTRVSQGRTNDLQRYLAAAQEASKRAAALTHRLLAFSRRQTLDPKPTDVNRLVAGMEDLVRRTVGPAVAVEVVGAGGLWATLVDPNQLENALLNLCINARDAMPDGGRLTVGTGNEWLDQRAAGERDLPPGQYVALRVGDTGVGMTAEVAARAFDPFFTTKPIGMGTGLGLSMVYGFARQSGGQVRICSEPGQGATLCLYLPRHHGAVELTDEPGETVVQPRAGQNETVLVVDDEPTIRMLAAEVLEDLGYTAMEAVDGAAGLQVLRSSARIDLLVTDVGLPGGMNGRQLADAARAVRPNLKVLFITGYAEAAVGNGHLDPGMHVLTKPFAMEALAHRIRALIAET